MSKTKGCRSENVIKLMQQQMKSIRCGQVDDGVSSHQKMLKARMMQLRLEMTCERDIDYMNCQERFKREKSDHRHSLKDKSSLVASL